MIIDNPKAATEQAGDGAHDGSVLRYPIQEVGTCHDVRLAGFELSMTFLNKLQFQGVLSFLEYLQVNAARVQAKYGGSSESGRDVLCKILQKKTREEIEVFLRIIEEQRLALSRSCAHRIIQDVGTTVHG